MRENAYQTKLIRKIRDLFPGCVILKNDPSYLQGVLDLIILHEDSWAMLEVKASAKSKTRPNQDYYVEEFDRMSFAAYIYPENESEVLDDLQSTFASRRTTRVSKR